MRMYVYVCLFIYLFIWFFFIYRKLLDVLFGVDIISNRERYCVSSCVCELLRMFVFIWWHWLRLKLKTVAHTSLLTYAYIYERKQHITCTQFILWNVNVYILKFVHLSAVCVVIMQIIRNSHIYLFFFMLRVTRKINVRSSFFPTQ